MSPHYKSLRGEAAPRDCGRFLCSARKWAHQIAGLPSIQSSGVFTSPVGGSECSQVEGECRLCVVRGRRRRRRTAPVRVSEARSSCTSAPSACWKLTRRGTEAARAPRGDRVAAGTEQKSSPGPSSPGRTDRQTPTPTEQPHFAERNLVLRRRQGRWNSSYSHRL